ncbi:hypothetical protein [Nonlabens spongiae]|nr:hypothetical protein [Nonlabens spongiae]
MLLPLLAFALNLIGYVKIKGKVLTVLVSGLLIASFISISHGLLKGQFISQMSREEHNLSRLNTGEENADTMIQSPIYPTNPLGESISIFYGFFTVNLPFNGIRFINKPQVISFLIWQLSLTILLIYFYSKVLRNKDLKHERWVFHLVFAYFIAQGIFEPDLGSAIRHKIGILPLIWLAVYYDQGFIKRPHKIYKLKWRDA